MKPRMRQGLPSKTTCKITWEQHVGQYFKWQVIWTPSEMLKPQRFLDVGGRPLPAFFVFFLHYKIKQIPSHQSSPTALSPTPKKKIKKKERKSPLIEIATLAAVTERPLIEKHNNYSNGHCSSQALFLPQEPNQTLPQWRFSLLQHGIYCFVSRHGLIEQDSSLFLSIWFISIWFSTVFFAS